MKKTEDAARAAAKKSLIFIVIAVCFCLASLAMGFIALSGVFAGNSGVAAALMATLTLLTLIFGALGASARASARMKGWVPAKELGVDTVQAKNHYLRAALEAERAKSQDMRDCNETNSQQNTSEHALEDVIETTAEEAPTSEDTSEGTSENTSEEFTSDFVAYKPEEKPTGVTEEELLVAAAEALLAEAASEKTDSLATRKDEDSQESLLSEETFALLAGSSLYMDNTEDDNPDSDSEHNSANSTIRTRRIAKERIVTVDKMLSRAEDVFAVSRDLARAQTQDPAFATLSIMLRENPFLDMPDMPKVKPIKLTRNDRNWMGGTNNTISQDIFDALLSLEATYNINQDIQIMLGKKPDMERQTDTRRRVIAVLSDVSKIKPDYKAKVDYFSCAYPDGMPEGIGSEWGLRTNIANAAENARLPFRISFDMMTNASVGLVLISLEIPRPACFCFVGNTEADQHAFARDYAIRSAVFMARIAYDAGLGAPVKRVVVCCHPHNDPRILLSIEATAESMPRLKSLTGFMAPMPIPMGCSAIRILCEKDWLDQVTPHILPGDEILQSLRYVELAESSDRECDNLLVKATGALRECDLGIRAEAPLDQAWMHLGDLGETTGSAVAAIRAVSDASANVKVKEGCERAMRALVEGSVEPSRMDHLTAIYKGDKALAETLAFGLNAYTSQSEPDMERAITKLEEQLGPRMQISLMDDTETAFRYFHSVSDRIHFNLTSSDPRAITLVPHNYYAANEMCAYLLCQVGRAKEAESYANETRRISPFAPASATVLARVFERQERTMEALELVNDALLHATTVHDAALCYYRIAYLQWRAGREDLANASYRLTIALHTEISNQARVELDELLAANDKLGEMTPTAACKKLAEAGIHVWDLDGFKSKMAQAAILCADQKLYPVAAQLSLGLLEFQKDDALTDVYRSFSV